MPSPFQRMGDGRGAVLLGGHGAGRTLAALALARRSWLGNHGAQLEHRPRPTA
ncbi:hypothetical protein ACWC1D_00860 [Streptomyces sp. NPDC001478]